MFKLFKTMAEMTVDTSKDGTLDPNNHEPDLEKQWQIFLKQVNLSEDQMHSVQLQETKRAFFGAMGRLLFILNHRVSKLPEDEAVATMESLWSQVREFWNIQK